MYPWTVFPTNLKIFYDINKMLIIAVIVGIWVNLPSIQLCNENPDATINPCKKWLTKCIYNYFLLMHVIKDFGSLAKSTKYETFAELYTQVSYFVLFTL